MGSLGAVFLLALSVGSTDAACRDPKQRHKFDTQQGYPHGRKGYVVDHICALACGGIDDPKNMQYQTYKDGKLKDKWERTPEGCKKSCTPENSTPSRQVFNCR
jgi:hypothetical protein